MRACIPRVHRLPQGRRRTADAGARPAGPGTSGRLWRVRGLGPGRGRREADVLRPVRPPAPRPGVGRHRGQQRPADPRLQGHGPGLAGLRRVDALQPGRPHRHRPLPLLDHRLELLEERPADVPRQPRRLDRARPQRQPDQHPRAQADGRGAPQGAGRARPPPAPGRGPVHQRHGPGHRASRPPPRHHPRAAGARGAAAAQGRLLVRLDERGHRVRRPRPAGHPPAGPRPALARLGRRQRGRRPGHRRRQRRPRGRARRADRHRRERPALPQVRRAGAQGLRVRVRLPRPPRRHHRRPQRPRGPRRDGPPAGRSSTPSTPTW